MIHQAETLKAVGRAGIHLILSSAHGWILTGPCFTWITNTPWGGHNSKNLEVGEEHIKKGKEEFP